jgi:hypothetical protein
MEIKSDSGNISEEIKNIRESLVALAQASTEE